MIKKIFLYFLSLNMLYLGFFNPGSVSAIENPQSVPNNKIGIHILFPDEIEAASKLINSNGGDYGYVTITIQAGDKDIQKWQAFFDKAKRYHVIPIIRLSTEGDPRNTAVWRKPNDTDIVDFANFLDSLVWPMKNRYIIVFNEVNRGDEWGGRANPKEYAEILSFAITVFKSKSTDFFMLPAGLDNAAPQSPDQYINEYNFLRLMDIGVPGIFNQIDGLSSHSYPNPGFSTPPEYNTPMSINSFQYEKALVKTMTPKNLPIFLTETGWSTEVIPDKLAASYYLSALGTVWSDPNIVAVTPFLLQGQGGSFQKFSFFGANGTFTQQYQAWNMVPKIKGKPTLRPSVLAAETKSHGNDVAPHLPTLDFSESLKDNKKTVFPKQLRAVYKWLVKID